MFPKSEYLRWFNYEKEAHELVLNLLRSVPKEKRSSPEFQKIVDLFGHIAAARRLWLFRFGVLPNGPDRLEPVSATLEAVTEQLQQSNALWTEFYEKMQDGGGDNVFQYTSTEGKRFQNTIHEILIQLHGHSIYHRGQIATLLHRIDVKPVQTDYLLWTRKPLL